MAITFIRSYI